MLVLLKILHPLSFSPPLPLRPSTEHEWKSNKTQGELTRGVFYGGLLKSKSNFSAAVLEEEEQGVT